MNCYMKPLRLALILAAFSTMLSAQNSESAKPADKMPSTVLPWTSLVPNTPTKNGSRRAVFEQPTATLDKFHLHVSQLNPGENTGALHRHPQEEVIVVKEGTLEVNIDGAKHTAGPGAMIFFSANENENMTNIGSVPAVYYVFQFFTALTPKS